MNGMMLQPTQPRGQGPKILFKCPYSLGTCCSGSISLRSIKTSVLGGAGRSRPVPAVVGCWAARGQPAAPAERPGQRLRLDGGGAAAPGRPGRPRCWRGDAVEEFEKEEDEPWCDHWDRQRDLQLAAEPGQTSRGGHRGGGPAASSRCTPQAGAAAGGAGPGRADGAPAAGAGAASAGP